MQGRQSNTMARKSTSTANARRQAIPGNPKARYERYIELARNAALSGDEIATENYYQHAEHYLRQMREGA
jgi:hypothetical protein